MIEDDKMDLNQMDLSDEKKTINYAHLNDEFGDVDISDEEDLIAKHQDDKKTSKTQNRYEKLIKQGGPGGDKYMFPNYFMSQKARAKITAQDEKEGTKIFLANNDKKETQKASQKNQITSTKKSNVKGGKSRSKSNRRIGRKNYKTDIESEYEDSEEIIDKKQQNQNNEEFDQEMEGQGEDEENKDSQQEYLKHAPQKNANCQQLKRSNFAKMKYMLDCGFNLLIYGVGSKYDIINLFIQDKLIKRPNSRNVLMFNGYLSQVSCSMKALLKEVRNYLLSDIYKGRMSEKMKKERFQKTGNLHEQVAQIKQSFRHVAGNQSTILDNEFTDPDNQYDLTIVIHSMDIGVLKQDESQDLLSELAAIPQISLIITVDHIGVTRLWNDSQMDRFNFYSVQLDTFQTYDKEYHYQPDLFSAKNDNQENGIAYILKSMTQNQRNIIKIIAQYQMEHSEEKGMKIKDLLNECVENMLCNNQKGLKEYLAEAKDHKVVLERTDDSGYTYMYMTYPISVLEKIVNNTLDYDE